MFQLFYFRGKEKKKEKCFWDLNCSSSESYQLGVPVFLKISPSLLVLIPDLLLHLE